MTSVRSVSGSKSSPVAADSAARTMNAGAFSPKDSATIARASARARSRMDFAAASAASFRAVFSWARVSARLADSRSWCSSCSSISVFAMVSSWDSVAGVAASAGPASAVVGL